MDTLIAGFFPLIKILSEKFKFQDVLGKTNLVEVNYEKNNIFSNWYAHF